MAKKTYEPNRVRPKNATPELAVELHKTLTLQQIGDAWGISKTAIWLLIKKAEKRAAKSVS